MFAIVDGTAHVAPEGDARAHFEWFLDEGWLSRGCDPAFEGIVRGFVDGSGLHAYRGCSFEHAGVLPVLAPLLAGIAREAGAGEDCPVFLGHVPGRSGATRGKVAAGTVGTAAGGR